jgi:hypothetical protein
MMKCYILHLLHHLVKCAFHNREVLLQSLQKFPLFPSPPFEFFPTFIEFHGVLDPIVFEQTQALHYFFPILACEFKLKEINLVLNMLSFV